MQIIKFKKKEILFCKFLKISEKNFDEKHFIVFPWAFLSNSVVGRLLLGDWWRIQEKIYSVKCVRYFISCVAIFLIFWQFYLICLRRRSRKRLKIYLSSIKRNYFIIFFKKILFERPKNSFLAYFWNNIARQRFFTIILSLFVCRKKLSKQFEPLILIILA